MIREYRAFETSDGIYQFRKRFDTEKEATQWLDKMSREEPEARFIVMPV